MPYTASKGAVKMMTRGLAAELGKHNIQVNAIGPGYFITEINKALIADESLLGLGQQPHPGRALGRDEGTGRRGDLPVLGGVGLRQRPSADGRWRADGGGVGTSFPDRGVSACGG